MSTSAGLHRYTYADYLALEAASNVKHEFLAGEIYGMAGGTPEHAAFRSYDHHLLRAFVLIQVQYEGHYHKGRGRPAA